MLQPLYIFGGPLVYHQELRGQTKPRVAGAGAAARHSATAWCWGCTAAVLPPQTCVLRRSTCRGAGGDDASPPRPLTRTGALRAALSAIVLRGLLGEREPSDARWLLWAAVSPHTQALRDREREGGSARDGAGAEGASPTWIGLGGHG